MNEDMRIRRGDIYFADLNPVRGSEQGGIRPVVIMQNNTGNRHSPTTQVVPLSTNVDKKADLPTHYKLPPVSGLDQPSIALAEQLATIDKSRLSGYIGHLDYFYLYGINKAVLISVGNGCLCDQLAKPYFREPMEMCLCASCDNTYFNDPNCRIYRKNPYQVEKDQCTYCNSRYGFDFIIKRFAQPTKPDQPAVQRDDA